MQINIEKPVPNSHTPNSFEVVISTMEGDADHYENVIVGPFIKDKDEYAIEILLGVLEEMKNHFPHGMGGSDNYNEILGFQAWFDYMEEDKSSFDERFASYSFDFEEYSEMAQLADKFSQLGDYGVEWPHSPNYGNPNSYDGYKIFYYDENQVEYTTNVT